MYEIVIKDKDKKIIFIGNTYSIIENIRFSNFEITFSSKYIKYFDIGNTIEFFNKPHNELSFFSRIVINIDGNNIIVKDTTNPYKESFVLDRLKRDKVRFRLNKLNKIS